MLALTLLAAACASQQVGLTVTPSTVQPGEPAATDVPFTVNPIPIPTTATFTLAATLSPDWKFTLTPLAETDAAARQQTSAAYDQTQNAGYYQTNTAMVETLQATITPSRPRSFFSPDGKFKAEVIIYGCTNIPMPMNTEGTYSYEMLKITNLSDHKVWEVENQIIYCQGLGAYGLGGLFWSANSRYFYYTTAREGVPDGSGSFGWMRPAARFDVTTGEKLSLNSLVLSPDRSKVAAGDGIDLVVWDLNGDETARFPGETFITDRSVSAWLRYFAWSPDGKSVAYIIRISPTMTSDVLLASLELKQSKLLVVSSSPEFGEVHWKDPNHLSLASWQNFSQEWVYDLADESLIPPTRR